MNGSRGRGSNGRPMNTNNRIREEQAQSFIKDMRRNVEAENAHFKNDNPGTWNDSQDWNGSTKTDKQSPRHKARQPFNSTLNQNNSWKGSSDWNDQEEDWDAQPMTPTAMVSPRKIEERDGKLTVTRNNERLGSRAMDSKNNPPNSPPKQIPYIKPLRNESGNQYTPAPFKENGKPPPLIQQDVGFPQHSSQYNKPFSQSHETPNSNWKCPDPGCKQVNGQNRNSCTKCGIAYKAANDYISNYACDRVKQEYSNQKKNLYNKADNYSNSSNSSNGFQSSPSIPQPMLQQSQNSIKDWNLDVEQTQAQHNWPTPITTSVDSWGVENMMIAQHQLVGIDPTMQYGMVMNQVQVPSYSHPPPFFNHSQHMAPVPPYYTQSGTDFFPNQSADFQAGYPHNNMTVFNPSAQVFVPPGDQLPASMYKAPPPMPSAQKTYPPNINTVSNSRPSKPANKNFNAGSEDSNLMISLNKPPTPLALRRPQEQRPITKTSSEKLISRNSFEKENPEFVRQTSNEGNQPCGKVPPRFQRQRENQAKPPSMIEMQSGSLKKGTLPPPPPGKGNGLLIFGTSNVVNHLDESKLASQLKIPVKCFPAMKLDVFQKQSLLLNPSRDWLVLVHGLGNDARNIAMTRKSDAEKASEADDVANEFCDIIETKILGSAQHICVFVSMLLPRVDFQERPGMANPNNVRKVINVQITQRLYENPRVTLINSDKALDWGDDEQALNALMEADGYHLTEKGFSVMLGNWIEHVKKKMKDTNYNPESPKHVQPSATIKRSEPTPLMTENKPMSASETNTESVQQNSSSEVPGQKAEENSAADEEETVPDPFGSYEAPCEIVSPKVRTLSSSGPFVEETDELDDDALPNLEMVVPAKSPTEMTSSSKVKNLEDNFSSIAIEESQEKSAINGPKGKLKIVPNNEEDEDEEFHDVDDGGFIDDSYCGDGEFKDSIALPSMMSLGPSSDIGTVSGHFMEDSYLPSSEPNGGLQRRKTIEFCFKCEQTVKIAGDFNDWQPQLMEKGSENCWKFLIDLPEGEYHYKYFVDGEWEVDETSPVTDKDGSKQNSITVLC